MFWEGGRGERFLGRLICRRRVCGILFRVCMSCLRRRGLRKLYGIVVSDLVSLFSSFQFSSILNPPKI